MGQSQLRQPSMRKSTSGSLHCLDVALGARIRLRRNELGLSQTQLGTHVGVTFQQIQKYETGANRVSFSRLVAIVGALRCCIADIAASFDGPEAPATFSRYIGQLGEPGAVDLLDAYSSIRSSQHRRAILKLAEQLAEIAPTGVGTDPACMAPDHPVHSR